MTYKLSPSSLSLMEECPRCFWLTLHGKWKRPQGIFPSLPSGMDKILKEHFNHFRDKNELPPEICENSHCRNLRLFDDKEKLKIWQSNLKGIRYEDEEGNILHGAIDNILVNGKNLIVLDYKTRGYTLKEDTHEHYQNQLDIYNFLLRKNGYDTEDYSFLLFYIPNRVNNTGEVVFDTNLVKVKTNSGNGEKVFKKGLRLLNEDIPTNRCKWCEGIDG